MWTRELGRVEEAPASPPEERGERLAVLPRGKLEEMRLALDEYENHPFVSLRIWSRSSPEGAFWPTKKGVTIRIGELDEVIEALSLAAERV